MKSSGQLKPRLTACWIALLLGLGAAFVWIDLRVALFALICAWVLPIVGANQCHHKIVHLVSTRYPAKWLTIKQEIGERWFVYDNNDLSDPELAELKRTHKTWGKISAATLIATLVLIGTLASIIHRS